MESNLQVTIVIDKIDLCYRNSAIDIIKSMPSSSYPEKAKFI